MIHLQNLTFQYRASGSRFIFPDQLIEQGKQCLLLGNSGSGKTTLLHILAGILKPQQGKVIVGNQDLTSLKGSALDHYRGQHIGLVFQNPHLIQALSVQENLYLTQYLAGLKQNKQSVKEVLAALGLSHREQAKVTTLSQGEAQRASIARAVLNKPKVLLADEPTSSLDDDNCYKVIAMLQEQASRHNATLMIATHDQRIKDIIKLHLTVSST